MINGSKDRDKLIVDRKKVFLLRNKYKKIFSYRGSQRRRKNFKNLETFFSRWIIFSPLPKVTILSTYL